MGFRGSLFSAAGIILPSFIAILLIAILFSQIRENPVVESIFMGIRPAVVALIAAPCWDWDDQPVLTSKTYGYQLLWHSWFGSLSCHPYTL